MQRSNHCDAFDNILSHGLLCSVMLMGEETLQSFEDSIPGFRAFATLVERDLGDGEKAVYWEVNLPREERR